MNDADRIARKHIAKTLRETATMITKDKHSYVQVVAFKVCKDGLEAEIRWHETTMKIVVKRAP